MTRASRYPLFAALAVSAACTVHKADVPALTGPSEFAQSIVVTATPDAIQQDGFSQSLVTVVAHGPDGKPISGLSIRMQTAADGAIQDFGLLSARTIVTGGDGRATVTYTAPPPPAVLGSNGSRVSILATPIGNNYDTAQTQSADIRLTPPGIVLPPASAPTAAFTVSPTPVTAGVGVIFDAGLSCATQTPCASTTGITDFVWTFGDGTSATGQTVTHVFGSGGTFVVTLTVTNERGLRSSVSQAVAVGTSGAPTASFVVSPSGARAGATVNFNASTSTADTGRRLTQYLWDFGDGTAPQSGVVTTHAFVAAGTYTVVLTVADDTGQKGSTTQAVTVLP